MGLGHGSIHPFIMDGGFACCISFTYPIESSLDRLPSLNAKLTGTCAFKSFNML